MSFSLIVKTAHERQLEAQADAQAQIAAAINAHVEERARAMGYNSASACAGYQHSTVKVWAAEAQAFVAWRDQVWQAVFESLDRNPVDATTLDRAAILAALPAFPGQKSA